MNKYKLNPNEGYEITTKELKILLQWAVIGVMFTNGGSGEKSIIPVVKKHCKDIDWWPTAQKDIVFGRALRHLVDEPGTYSTLNAVKYLKEKSVYGNEWQGAGMWEAVGNVLDSSKRVFTKDELDKLLEVAQNF